MSENSTLHTFTVVWQKIEDTFNSFIVSHVHATDAKSASDQVQQVQPSAVITSVEVVPVPPAPQPVIPALNEAELANLQEALRAWINNSNLDNSSTLMVQAKKYLGY